MTKYYNARIKVCLLKDIKSSDIGSVLSNLIFFGMNQNEYLRDLHSRDGFKGYSFSGGLYPFERDGVYYDGEFYDFNIRAFDFDLIDKITSTLKSLETKDLIVVDTEITQMEFEDIKKFIQQQQF